MESIFESDNLQEFKLKVYPSINMGQLKPREALQLSVKHSSEKIFDFILRSIKLTKNDLNAYDKFGYTPLQLAAIAHSFKIFKTLLEDSRVDAMRSKKPTATKNFMAPFYMLCHSDRLDKLDYWVTVHSKNNNATADFNLDHVHSKGGVNASLMDFFKLAISTKSDDLCIALFERGWAKEYLINTRLLNLVDIFAAEAITYGRDKIFDYFLSNYPSYFLPTVNHDLRALKYAMKRDTARFFKKIISVYPADLSNHEKNFDSFIEEIFRYHDNHALEWLEIIKPLNMPVSNHFLSNYLHDDFDKSRMHLFVLFIFNNKLYNDKYIEQILALKNIERHLSEDIKAVFLF